MLTCEESKRQLYEGIIAGRPIPELETILWDAVVAYQNSPGYCTILLFLLLRQSYVKFEEFHSCTQKDRRPESSDLPPESALRYAVTTTR